MAVLKPFAAVRPVPSLVRQVAALPYDVMNSDEAREMVRDNPYSFLHVDKAEIDLDPSVDPYDDQVYAKAADTLKRMRADGIYIRPFICWSDCFASQNGLRRKNSIDMAYLYPHETKVR